MNDRDLTRRKVLRIGGSVGIIGATGCTELAKSDNIQDTDEDGVIDSEDYAPRDASVQREEQVQEKTKTTEKTTTESSQFVFEDRFESGSLNQWRELTLDDPSNKNGSNWSITTQSIEGNYSAHSQTQGDKNHIITDERVVDTSENFRLSVRWRTSSDNSRGLAFYLTNGQTINDGAALQSVLSGQARWLVDGGTALRINGEEKRVSEKNINSTHTIEVSFNDGQVSCRWGDSEFTINNLNLSGAKYLGFNSSGHYGSESTITIDEILVKQ